MLSFRACAGGNLTLATPFISGHSEEEVSNCNEHFVRKGSVGTLAGHFTLPC